MEKNNLPCPKISEKDAACCDSGTLKIFDKFQALYEDLLNQIDESSVDSLQLKVKLLQDWVSDLTEQNVMLVKTVEELEEEALKRVALLQARMPQKQDPQDPCLTTKLSSQESSIAQLTTELEDVKKQLLDKECLLKSYLKRVEDLRHNAEASKQVKHCSSMTEETWTSKTDQLSKLHDELNRVELHLNKTQKETCELKCKLSEAEKSIQKLKCHLVTSDENAKDMRAALTAEVAEKHDMILALKREVQQLEEQLRQANMQTHFKDDIIKELRKEVKVARSKLWFLGSGSSASISPLIIMHGSDESMLNSGTSCVLELYQKAAPQSDNSKAVVEISRRTPPADSSKSDSTIPSKPYENSQEHISEKSNHEKQRKKQKTKLTVRNVLEPKSGTARFIRFEEKLPEKVDSSSKYITNTCPVHGRIAFWENQESSVV